jgi:hypothetical protein
MNLEILKRNIFITGFLFQNICYAQVYVHPDTYIYVNNEQVFIKNNLELNSSTSNFYLRADAQLLQGSTNASTNKGVGDLSVFQEGTVNNFQYNYWCSPVGGNIAAEGNSPFGITQLKDIVNLTASNGSVILDYYNRNGAANPLAIAPSWIHKFICNDDYADWEYVGAASTLNAGEGFTMKGTSGINANLVNGVQNNPGNKQRYDFRGKPNDGTISISVLTDQMTLTGNPYPSAIDLSLFLTDALSSTGIAYFWEHDKTANSHLIANYRGGYGTFSPVSRLGSGIYVPATFYSYDGAGNEGGVTGAGNSYERRFSPIGQGFMIEGLSNGTVQMKNSYRVFVKEGSTNFSEFEKNSNTVKSDKNSGDLSVISAVSSFDYSKLSIEPVPQIRINTLLNNEGVRQMVLAFDPEATDKVDHAMDALSPSEDIADAYFVIDTSEYVIDVIKFDINKKIPIGFRNTEKANYKISVKEVLNVKEVENVYLHDIISDLFYDIKKTFCELTLDAGVNNTQYEITFKNGLEKQETQNTFFEVYQNNINKMLIINNPLKVNLISYELYDVVGKLVNGKKDLGNDATYTFSTSNLSDGIYIVKLTTNEKTDMGQKIIVEN